MHSRETRHDLSRRVSRETRRLSRDGGNLLLSGTVQNKAIEIAFFAVLTVLSDSIFGDVIIHSQSSRESFPGLCKNYAARKHVFSVSLHFCPFYITSIYGLGKAANPPHISVLGFCDFAKFRILPPLSFELKTMS